MVESEGCEFVDFRFVDLPGVMQHVSDPGVELLDEGQFDDGHGFDGSSIRGFQEIQESDMILMPDPEHRLHRPVHDSGRPRVIHCCVADPVTGESYSRDPRYVATQGRGVPAQSPASPTPPTSAPRPSSSSSTTCASTPTQQLVALLRRLGRRRRGTPARRGARTSATSRAPSRATSRCRRWTTTRTCARRWRRRCTQVGIETELHHHEVASGGQGEIGMKFDTLLRMADKLMTVQVRAQGRRLAGRQDA